MEHCIGARLREIADKTLRARKYWATFVVGDRVAIQTQNAKGFRLRKGVIRHVNRDYMNVVVDDSVFSFKFWELVLLDRPTKIKHATQRRTLNKAVEVAR